MSPSRNLPPEDKHSGIRLLRGERMNLSRNLPPEDKHCGVGLLREEQTSPSLATRREAERDRTNCRALAQQLRAAARHGVHDQNRLGHLQANHSKFRQSLLLGPLATCYSCSRFMYPSGGSYVNHDNSLLHVATSHLPEGEDRV